VHSLTQPDVSGDFTVARDAPALFQRQNTQNILLALATHQDGTPITSSSPARRGETVTLYGTGFGSYDHTLPDGFPAPANDTYKVLDQVTVQIDGVQKTPDFAGAMTGMVGTIVVRFPITSDILSGAAVNVSVTVGGRKSTVLVLPVQ
jgi:uncharacterized protein (TIGR03437 family)